MPKTGRRRGKEWISPELTLNTRRKTSQRTNHGCLILRRPHRRHRPPQENAV